MIARYIVQLEKPCRYGAGWDVVHSRAYKTLERAKRAMLRMLDKHPREVTRAGGGDRRGWFGSVIDAKSGWTVMNCDAPHKLVPSVGELGYW